MRNKRLGQVGYLWALSLLTTSPGARAHYDRRRERGDNYSAAARNLANRYLGILYHCLHTRQTLRRIQSVPAHDQTTRTRHGRGRLTSD